MIEFSEYMKKHADDIADDKLNVINISRDSSRHKHKYTNTIITLDTETSSYIYNGKKYAYVYIWQLCIGDFEGNYETIYSRDLDDLKKLLDMLNTSGQKQMVFVHNLGYDFQFIRNVIPFIEVFAVKDYKPVKAYYKDFEFRDTYIMTGSSLENLAKDNKLKTQKLVGDINHTLVRTPDTPLTSKEMSYCENDVIVLYEFILKKYVKSPKFKSMNDIPITKTSVVRHAVHEYIRKHKLQFKVRAIIDKLKPDEDLFNHLHEAFTGGLTTSNAVWSYGIIADAVHSMDITSSYPAIMFRSNRFPMGKFTVADTGVNPCILEATDTMAYIATVELTDMKSKFGISLLSGNKIDATKSVGVITANGRIVKADKVVTTITNIDYENLKMMYTFKVSKVTYFACAKQGYLPDYIVIPMLGFYRDKTVLKGIDEQYEQYMIQKGNLNSIYGSIVMNPLRDFIYFSCEDGWLDDEQLECMGKNEDGTIKDTFKDYFLSTSEKLEKYYASKNTIYVYQWGVWVTALARQELVKMLVKVGNNAVYSDTDSIKFIGKINIAQFFKRNLEIHKENEKAGEHFKVIDEMYIPKSKDEKPHELGLWTYEGCSDENGFKTLGAKRYVYLQNGVYHATVAGCPKRAIELYLEKNGLDSFTDGLLLSGQYLSKPVDGIHYNHSFKTTMTYLENEPETIPVTDYLGQTTNVKTGTGVFAEGCSFQLTVSSSYLKFLAGFKIGE